MKKCYLFSMLFCLVLGLATKNVNAATQADSITITLWCGINQATYDKSAGGVWVTGDFTAPIKHGNTDFWWHMPLDSIGKLNKVDSVFWYKIVFHYKPGSLADSAKSTHGNPEMAHDSAFWYFSLAGTWDLGETVGAPCNLAWGSNRALLMGAANQTLAFRWAQCPVLADPSLPVVGVAQLSTSELNIFPNPAGDVLNLKSTRTIAQISIVDLTGRTVQQVKLAGVSEANISISNLRSQLYFVKVEYTNGNVSTTKLMKR